MGIDFYGFFNPYNEIEIDLLNKAIVDIGELSEFKEDFIIVVPYSQRVQVEKYPEYEKIKDILAFEGIRKEIKEKDQIVIYGAGEKSLALYNSLQQNKEIKISVILDSNPEKENKYLDKIIIKQPAYIRNITGSKAVIIASTYVNEMYETLLSYGVAREDIYMDVRDIFLDCAGQKEDGRNVYISKIPFFQMGRTLYGKSIVVYGQRTVVNQMTDILQKIGIDHIKKVCREGAAEEGEIYNILNITGIDEKEIDYVMLVDHPNKMQYRALLDMGFDEKAILYAGQNGEYSSYDMNFMSYGLDPTLGYVKFRDKIPQSFREYAWDTSSERRITILALGGSTTDAVGARNQCWPAYLSDMLKKADIPHVIYNGAVEGYNTSQELLKLIRDGILLKPNICISYSGANNNEQGTIVAGHPFLNINQKNVFEQLDSHVSFIGRMAYGLDLGKKVDMGTGEYYLLQIRLMYAICKELGIKFFAFLQPTIFTKKTYYRKDNETLAWNGILKHGETFEYCEDLYTGAVQAHLKFHEGINKQDISKISYLYDLRDIFD